MPASQFPGIKERRRKLRKAAIIAGLLAGLYTVQIVEGASEVSIQHDSILTGRAWLKELLHGNKNRIKNNMGMRKHVFCRLVQVLEEKGGLESSRKLTPSDQLAIFLYFAVTNVSNRKVAERFQ